MQDLIDTVSVCAAATYRIAFELEHQRAPDAYEAAASVDMVQKICARVIGNRSPNLLTTHADLKRMFIALLHESLTLMGESCAEPA